MESYLLNCTQSVDINVTISDTIKSEYGFPQVSTIGISASHIIQNLLRQLPKEMALTSGTTGGERGGIAL